MLYSFLTTFAFPISIFMYNVNHIIKQLIRVYFKEPKLLDFKLLNF